MKRLLTTLACAFGALAPVAHAQTKWDLPTA